MSDPSITGLERNYTVDLSGRVRRPWLMILSFVIVLVLTDLLLGLALRGERTSMTRPVDSRTQLRVLLQTTAESSDTTWLALGDSVMAGDVMAPSVPNWIEQRPVDYLRREAASSPQVEFAQVALNGMLPVDMLRIVRELDLADPSGEVGLIVELNARYFSPSYQNKKEPTRQWLEEVSPDLVSEDGVNWWESIKHGYHEATLWLVMHLPIVRHHDFMPWPVEPRDAVLDTVPSETRIEQPGEAEGMARMLEHYRDLALSPESKQVQALEEIRHRLQLHNRHAVFFTTPLNSDFRNTALTSEEYGEYQAFVSKLIKADGNVRLVHLDYGPVFPEPLFLDHCHMVPEGNRRLALNLLQELAHPLAGMPDMQDLIYGEDPDRPLVWSLEPGSSDGGAWNAQFQTPDGIALSPQRRIAIADTGNHCLRELDIQSQTVRLMAGVPGKAGNTNGPAFNALLQSPRAPCYMNGTLYFVDADGANLRCIDGDEVRTLTPAGPENWRKIDRIKPSSNFLFLLDSARNCILYFDSGTHQTNIAVSLPPQIVLKDFDIHPDGRIFLLDGQNNIHLVSKGSVETIYQCPPNANPVSNGNAVAFEKIRFQNIRSIRYVQRYDGILVEEVTPLLPASSDAPWKARPLKERTHLRLLSLKDRLCYSWIKPQISNWYTTKNAISQTVVSPLYRIGSMALDQESAALFYLERDRSHLYLLQDGIAASGRDTAQRGEYVRTNLQTQKFASQRIERLPRSGPYQIALFGSSMVEMSDLIPSPSDYRLGRILDRHMQDRLGVCNGMRAEFAVIERQGMSTKEAIEALENNLASGSRFDVIIVHLWAPWIINNSDDPAATAEILHRFKLAADRYDSLLVFIDGWGMTSRFQEGLLPQDPATTGFLAQAREFGFLTIEPSPNHLRFALSELPWGSPPWNAHHAAPWTIHSVAATLDAMLYPSVADHLAKRVPAMERPAAEKPKAIDPTLLLSAAFEDIKPLTEDVEFAEISQDAFQRTYDESQLRLFVSLNRIPEYEPGNPALLDRLATALACQVLSREAIAGRMTSLRVTMATFSNFDEYGQGIRDSATIQYDKTYDRTTLVEFVRNALDQ